MTSYKKTLDRVLQGKSDANIRFEALRGLLSALGFRERIKGGHHIFSREGVNEIVNLQPVGSMAKPYQVRAVRKMILKYGLVSHGS